MLHFNLIAATAVYSRGAQRAVSPNWPTISAEVLCQQGFGDFKHCKTSHLSEKTLDLEMTLALWGFSLVLSHSVNLASVYTLSSPIMSLIVVIKMYISPALISPSLR